MLVEKQLISRFFFSRVAAELSDLCTKYSVRFTFDAVAYSVILQTENKHVIPLDR